MTTERLLAATAVAVLFFTPVVGTREPCEAVAARGTPVSDVYRGEGRYPAVGDAARREALTLALRAAVEDAGVVVDASTVVADGVLRGDEVLTVAASTVRVMTASFTEEDGWTVAAVTVAVGPDSPRLRREAAEYRVAALFKPRVKASVHRRSAELFNLQRTDGATMRAFVTRLRSSPSAEAVRVLTAVLEVDDRWAQGYALRAMVRAKAGKEGLALRDLEAALRVDPEEPLVRYVRGVLHERRGRSRLAVKEYGEFIASVDDSTYAEETAAALAYLTRQGVGL